MNCLVCFHIDATGMGKSQLEIYLEERDALQREELYSSYSHTVGNTCHHIYEKFRQHHVCQFLYSNLCTLFLIAMYSAQVCLFVSTLIWQTQSSHLRAYLSSQLTTNIYLIASKSATETTVTYAGIIFIVTLLLLTHYYAVAFMLIPVIIGFSKSVFTNSLIRRANRAKHTSLTILNLLKCVQLTSLSVMYTHPLPPIQALEATLSASEGSCIFECPTIRRGLFSILCQLQNEIINSMDLFQRYIECLPTVTESPICADHLIIKQSLTSRLVKLNPSVYPCTSVIQKSSHEILDNLLPISICFLIHGVWNASTLSKSHSDFSTQHSSPSLWGCMFGQKRTRSTKKWNFGSDWDQVINQFNSFKYQLFIIFYGMLTLLQIHQSVTKFYQSAWTLCPYITANIGTEECTQVTDSSYLNHNCRLRQHLLQSRRRFEHISNLLWLCEESLTRKGFMKEIQETVVAPAAFQASKKSKVLDELQCTISLLTGEPFNAVKQKSSAPKSNQIDTIKSHLKCLLKQAENDVFTMVQSLESFQCCLNEQNTFESNQPLTGAIESRLTDVNKVIVETTTVAPEVVETVHEFASSDLDADVKNFDLSQSASFERDAQGRLLVEVFVGKVPLEANDGYLEWKNRKGSELGFGPTAIEQIHKSMIAELSGRLQLRLEATVEKINDFELKVHSFGEATIVPSQLNNQSAIISEIAQEMLPEESRKKPTDMNSISNNFTTSSFVGIIDLKSAVAMYRNINEVTFGDNDADDE